MPHRKLKIQSEMDYKVRQAKIEKKQRDIIIGIATFFILFMIFVIFKISSPGTQKNTDSIPTPNSDGAPKTFADKDFQIEEYRTGNNNWLILVKDNKTNQRFLGVRGFGFIEVSKFEDTIVLDPAKP